MTDDLEIHLIADSTGETAARIARAAVAQFPMRAGWCFTPWAPSTTGAGGATQTRC